MLRRYEFRLAAPAAVLLFPAGFLVRRIPCIAPAVLFSDEREIEGAFLSKQPLRSSKTAIEFFRSSFFSSVLPALRTETP